MSPITYSPIRSKRYNRDIFALVYHLSWMLDNFTLLATLLIQLTPNNWWM